MNVTEKEVTTTQKIYELTEQELKELKDEYYNKGISDLKNYFLYCFGNTRYKFNYGYTMDRCVEITHFCANKTNGIENKKNITFQDFVYGER